MFGLVDTISCFTVLDSKFREHAIDGNVFIYERHFSEKEIEYNWELFYVWCEKFYSKLYKHFLKWGSSFG